MPRELELFDGTVLEFPDNTADDVMIAAGQRETAKRKAVGQGDWQGVKDRVDAREASVFKPGLQGPVRPEDIANVRQAEARKQGELYGKTYGQNESGGEVFGRQAANTAGLGLPQLAEAYMPSWLGGQSVLPGAEAHEFIKASDAARGEESPIANAAGVVAGIGGSAIATPGVGIAKAATGLGAPGIVGRIAEASAIGSGMGAAQSGIESRGDVGEIGKGAALGAAGGLVGGAAGEALGGALARRAGTKALNRLAPSADDLGREAKVAYDEARQAGVWYSPQSFKNLVDDVKLSLSRDGLDETLHPKVMAVINRLDKETGPNSAVTLDKLDILRRVASSAAKSKEPDEGRLASKLIDKLDDFVDGAGPGDVLFGDAQKGASALQRARAAYAAKARSDRIASAIDMAEISTKTTGSGANIDNKLRQAAFSILKNKSAVRGFSPDEVAALRQVAEGSLGRNALRWAGKAAPSGIVSAGGGIGIGGSVGTMVAGPVGGLVGAAALPAAGQVAKSLADRGTRKAMENVGALVRSRTVPGGAQQIAKAGAIEKQRLARMLMTIIGAQTGVAAGNLSP